MKNSRMHIILLVCFTLYLSGCSTPDMNVSIKNPGSDLIGKSRVNLVTAGDTNLATNIRHSLQDLLEKSNLAAIDPLLASYGLNCDFTLTRRYADQEKSKSLLFVILKLEFINLTTNSTVRKTVLHGHVDSPNEVQGLVEDMVSGFFSQFSQASDLTVPVAKGWTGYDALGRKQLAQGDFGNAIENFKLAIDARPDDHAAYYNLGVAYESLNRNDQALKCYQRAYQIKPEPVYQKAILRTAK